MAKIVVGKVVHAYVPILPADNNKQLKVAAIMTSYHAILSSAAVEIFLCVGFDQSEINEERWWLLGSDNQF